MMAAGLNRSGERKPLEQMDSRTHAGVIGATFGLLALIPVGLILAFVADAYGWNSDWIYLPMVAAALASMIGGGAWRKRRLRHYPTAAAIGRGERIVLQAYLFALVFCMQASSLFLLLRDSTTPSAPASLATFIVASAACIPAYVAQLRGPVRLAAAIPLGVASSIAASLLAVALATKLTGS